jgi:hypothetical protein
LPTILLNKVDLPTFGLPTITTIGSFINKFFMSITKIRFLV